MFKTILSTIFLISLIIITNNPISSQAGTLFNPCREKPKGQCAPKTTAGSGSRKQVATALNNTTNQSKIKRYAPPCTNFIPGTRICKPTTAASRAGGTRRQNVVQ